MKFGLHGLTMAEAGRRVQPNVPRSTVSSIIQTFRRENRIGRQPRTGGRRTLLSREQEQEICNIVMANNAITLREIHNTIIQDNLIFQNINTISISTIDRVLKKHEMSMKQLYRVPFERNSDRVKELRFQYVNLESEYYQDVSITHTCFTVLCFELDGSVVPSFKASVFM
ncbi:hypothetical protein ABVT39_027823 [Epinephelus coioides]